MNLEYLDEEFNNAMFALESLLETYEPLSDYQLIFEADNPEVQQKVADTTKQEQSGKSFIVKGIEAIKAMIHQIVAKIKNFLQTLGMSKDERAKYEEFLKKCKTDPQLKGKQITVTDYRKVNAEYEALIKEAQAAIKNAKENEPTAFEALINKMKNACAEGAKGTGIILTAEILDKWGASNRQSAEWINKLLLEDENVLNNLEKYIGKEGTEDYKKRMKLYSSKSLLAKLIVQVRHKQYGNLEECIKQTYREAKGLVTGDLKSARKEDPHLANKLLLTRSRGPLTTVSKDNSYGLLGKVSNNPMARELAKNVAKPVAKGVGHDILETLKQKFGISNVRRYERIMKSKPQEGAFSNPNDYQTALTKWNNKRNKLLDADMRAIDKEIKNQAARQNTREADVLSFIFGSNKNK